MDVIFYNGNFKTLDPVAPSATAIAVENGIITAIGDNEKILSTATPNTHQVDLGGQLVLPAFCDSHMHLLHYADAKHKVDLSSAKSLEDAITLCRKALADRAESLNWLIGWGWNQDDWDDSRFPTKEDLDQISTEIPTVLSRTCGHVAVLNTKGLETIGIDQETPQPSGGHIDFDQSGKPNGILRENALNMIWNSIPIPGLDEIKSLIEEACYDALAQGITCIHTDDFGYFSENSSELVIQAYSELAKEGRLPIRIYQQCLLPELSDLTTFLNNGHKTGQTVGNYTIGPLKLLSDGSLGARTAFLRDAYNDDPSTKGMPLYAKEDLMDLIRIANDSGMQIAVHCIGNAALSMVLDCFEKVMNDNPRPDPRHGIVHCQITDLLLLERIKTLKLFAYIQPIFIRYDSHIADCRVGSDLACTSYNWRGMIDLGIHMGGSSDCPVEKFDVLPNIYSAVTRQDMNGWPEYGWYPENRITVDEAVRAFTVENAYASFEENTRGTIAVGKHADLAVLDRNIYEIDPSEIKDAKITMTVMDGEMKFQRR